MVETSELCNSFLLAPKPNGKVRSCLNQVMLNQAPLLIVHMGPTINDIFPKLTNVKYVTIIDVSSGYHKVKLGK